MNNPYISVIIPTYGRSKDLKGLLRSVEPNSETHDVLVVDDCSENPQEFDELKAKFPSVSFVRLDENVGPGQARNKGAELVSGEVILYLDSDTELEVGGIDLLTTFFKNNPEENVVSGWDSPSPLNRGFFPKFKALFMVSGAPSEDSDVAFIAGRCFAVRRKIMAESGGFDPKYKNADVEDFELGYRLKRDYGNIKFLTDLRVRHRYPTLIKQFKLYYRRVIMWIDLRSSAGGFDDSFGTTQNDAIVQILSALWPFVLVVSLAFGFIYPGLIFLAIAIYANRNFLSICRRSEGILFAVWAVICHSFLALAILFGAGVSVLKSPKLLLHIIG